MKNKKRWYVVQTKYNQEQTAIDNLKAQHFKVFFPQLLENRTSRGKPVVVTVPLFPSYVFIQFNIGKDRWRAISSTKGVAALVTATEERVSPLPDGFVENLKKDSDRKGFVTFKKVQKTLKKYAVGDEIMVKSGLFAGITGTYQDTKEDKVTILFTLLSNKKGVAIPIECLD